jgi:hypothetical protein
MTDEIRRNWRVDAYTFLFKSLNKWVEASRELLGDEYTARQLEDMAKAVRRHMPN